MFLPVKGLALLTVLSFHLTPSSAAPPANSSSSAAPSGASSAAPKSSGSSTSSSVSASTNATLSAPSGASISPSGPSAAPSGSSSAPPAFPTPPPLKPGQLPNSFPPNPNITASNNTFSPAWQDYYRVTQGLPNITFPLSGNFAGNLPVGRAGHPNNTLFFWGFETNTGSLTVNAGQLGLSPWMIWLGGGGGPGSSSSFTSMVANGPMLLHQDFSISQNPKSLNNLLDVFWVDQPVGSGFSTADSDGYAQDESQVAADFLGFLANLVKVFPSLPSRPLYLAGEDYAGVFIPYIAQALLGSSSPPVTLKKIVVGNGILGGFSVSPDLATISILESFPQVIKFDQSTFQAFQAKAHLCDFDVNVTYPQQTALPSFPPQPRRSSLWSTVSGAQAQVVGLLDRRDQPPAPLKRQSATLSNAIDPFYGCALFDEVVDYAANFSFPWTPGTLDLFDVPNVVQPQATIDAGVYFNSEQVRTGLHGPFSKNWTSISAYPFNSTTKFPASSNIYGDPSPEPATFFNDLVATATSKNVEVILYSGSNNAIAHHRSLEILIQNATFGGTRGFSRQPATPWEDDNGQVAGIVHQERGLLYALFDNVGGLTPISAPNAAYVFYRDFVISSNSSGSITVDSNNKLAVLGGEDPARADDAPRIATALILAQSTVAAPSASLAAWESFLASAVSAPLATSTSAAAAVSLGGWSVLAGVLACWVGVGW